MPARRRQPAHAETVRLAPERRVTFHLLVCALTRGLMLCGLWLTALGSAQAQAPSVSPQFTAVPALTSPVMDVAGMLAQQQRAALESVLRDYEQRTGSQIAILTVASTAPEAIEQYGIRVADAWRIGRKGIDDGVILIVAKDNPPALRRLRIEAGRGVQGTVTDAQSKRILQDVIAPHFRQNDFYGGLAAGVSALTTLLDREHFPQPDQPRDAQRQTEGGFGIGLFPILLFLLVFLLPLLRGGRRRQRLGSGGWGNASGVILGSVIGNAMGSRMGGMGHGGLGGGMSGGFGGFSGGGGTFDGGGASGDW